MILESSSESLLQNKAIELEKSSAIPLQLRGIGTTRFRSSATMLSSARSRRVEHHHVHRSPPPTFRDDREPPLLWKQDGWSEAQFSVKWKKNFEKRKKCFRAEGWTGVRRLKWLGKIRA
jgi:hypothetical protein